MGAEQFDHAAEGKTAREAFDKAVAEACYSYGHSGYTGTIAEKTEFVMVGKAATLEEARAIADKLMEDSDPRIDDKWGPAGCIKVGKGSYLFFGYASS